MTEAWQDSFDLTMPPIANVNGWANYTIRHRFEAVCFLRHSGSEVRFKIWAGTAGLTITSCYIGIATGDYYDFADTPTPVTFSGLSGVVIGSSGTIVTDDIDFEFGPEDAIIISMYCGAAPGSTKDNRHHGRYTHRMQFRTGNTAASTTPGWSTGIYHYATFITDFEVYGELPTPGAGAHRYWRVKALDIGVSGWFGISEIEMRESFGGPDVLRGVHCYFASATVEDSTDYGVWYAADNYHDPDHYWSSDDDPTEPWWAVDFGPNGGFNILEIAMQCPRNNYLPETGRLEYSDDAVSWTTKFSGTVPDGGLQGNWYIWSGEAEAPAERRVSLM